MRAHASSRRRSWCDVTSLETGFARTSDDDPAHDDVLLSPAEGIFALATRGGHLASPRRAIALFRRELARGGRGEEGRVAGALERTNHAHFRREGIGVVERGAYGVSFVAVDASVSGALALVHVGSVRGYHLCGDDARLVTEPHVVPARRGAPTLTRALAFGPSIEVASVRPALGPGDVLVLTSDGLAPVVLRPRVIQRFQAGVPPWTLANDIVRLGRGLGHEGTAVVLRAVS